MIALRGAAAGVTIRSLRAEDAGAVSALYAACMATEPGIGPVPVDSWTGYIRLARSGYGRDFLVASHGDDLIGLAESSLQDGGSRPCRWVKILVHPDRRRHGLGTRLLRTVVEQEPLEPVMIESLLRPGWTAGLGFVSRFGFAVTETEIIMRCSAFRVVREAPAGVEIARAVEPDAEPAAVIHNAAYRDEAGFVPQTGPEMLDLFRSTQPWTARLAGEIVAFAIVEHDENFTWLESLAVDPPHQGRGVGAALATRALTGDGFGAGRPAWLNVSASNTAARALYARLGFERRSERPRYGIPRDALLARLGG